MRKKSYYLRLLNLSENASQNEIRRAFMTRARKFHPDRNQGSHAPTTFRKYLDAYNYLKNEKSQMESWRSTSSFLNDQPQQPESPRPRSQWILAKVVIGATIIFAVSCAYLGSGRDRVREYQGYAGLSRAASSQNDESTNSYNKARLAFTRGEFSVCLSELNSIEIERRLKAGFQELEDFCKQGMELVYWREFDQAIKKLIAEAERPSQAHTLSETVRVVRDTAAQIEALGVGVQPNIRLWLTPIRDSFELGDVRLPTESPIRLSFAVVKLLAQNGLLRVAGGSRAGREETRRSGDTGPPNSPAPDYWFHIGSARNSKPVFISPQVDQTIRMEKVGRPHSVKLIELQDHGLGIFFKGQPELGVAINIEQRLLTFTAFRFGESEVDYFWLSNGPASVEMKHSVFRIVVGRGVENSRGLASISESALLTKAFANIKYDPDSYQSGCKDGYQKINPDGAFLSLMCYKPFTVGSSEIVSDIKLSVPGGSCPLGYVQTGSISPPFDPLELLCVKLEPVAQANRVVTGLYEVSEPSVGSQGCPAPDSYVGREGINSRLILCQKFHRISK